MPFTPHTLVTFGGNIGSGADAEHWQCGVRVGILQNGVWGPAQELKGYIDAAAGTLVTALQTGTSATGSLASFASVTFIKGAQIGANGKYLPASSAGAGTGLSNPYLLSANLAGASVSSMPPFVTIASSFHTLSSTKYARHGRIYLPVSVQQASSGSSRLAASTIAGCMALTKAILTALAKPSGTGGNLQGIRPVVASNHAGEVAEITEVRIGDVIDVQRRRKKALHENYTVSAWS